MIRAVYRMEVAGAERVPRRGPLLVVANHLSAIDPFVLGAVVPRPLRFMAKEELWRWRLLGLALEGLGAFPVGRGRGDRAALARGLELLAQGEAVAIFPGGYVRSGLPWYRGAARLALAAGAPVLPVRLVDTDRAVAGRKVGLPRLRAVVGEPIRVERAAPTVAAARALTERLQQTVESLAA